MAFRNIMHFLIAVEEVQTSEQLILELRRLLESYNIQHYSVFHHPRPTVHPIRLSLSSNWPDNWVNRYLEKKYILIDPMIRYLLVSQQPFTWKQAQKAFAGATNEKRMKDMTRDAASHGLVDGSIFPVHGRMGLIGALTISGPKLDLSPVEMSLFHTVATRAYLRLRDFMEPESSPKPDPIASLQLTHRSMEALSLLAEGMTSQEISEKLNLSRHTVDWHFNNIQGKLKARNRQHSVAMAMRLGLIS